MARNTQQVWHAAVNRAAHRRAGRLAAVAGALLTGCITRPVQAQGSGDGFLFQEPAGSIALRGGFARATAGGDLFSDITRRLTLGRGDFSGPTVGADLAIRVAPRLDVVLGSSYASTSTSSEFRDLVDQNDAAITQTTSLKRVPVMASVRAYLTPRGRSVGQYAWVPARFAPYVGAGGGAVWYKFRQQGDFVDYQTNAVFPDDITASQWTPAAQGLAGIDYSISPRIALTGEGKYLFARGKVNERFSNFDSIDLSGLSATVGIKLRL
ncbi:MAG: outer membrane protein [Gemmatimonadaceae bacterium]